jgi:Tfp pilus assembly protein PilW
MVGNELQRDRGSDNVAHAAYAIEHATACSVRNLPRILLAFAAANAQVAKQLLAMVLEAWRLLAATTLSGEKTRHPLLNSSGHTAQRYWADSTASLHNEPVAAPQPRAPDDSYRHPFFTNCVGCRGRNRNELSHVFIAALCGFSPKA